MLTSASSSVMRMYVCASVLPRMHAQILIDGKERMCSQFTTLGPDNVEVGQDGLLYVSVGAGMVRGLVLKRTHGAR